VSGPSFAWHAESGEWGDWDFVLYGVRCRCGWFLAKAEPIMCSGGINAVEGECKRHGHVTAETWDVIDADDLE
jgi:hypothetical protein